MTRRGGVLLPDTDARAVISAVPADLIGGKQVERPPEPSDVLAALTAHHVLERTDYPAPAFRFGHQQFQEYYATIEVRQRLLRLTDRDSDGLRQFTGSYVNELPRRALSPRRTADRLESDLARPHTDWQRIHRPSREGTARRTETSCGGPAHAVWPVSSILSLPNPTRCSTKARRRTCSTPASSPGSSASRGPRTPMASAGRPPLSSAKEPLSSRASAA